jgi:hypothetical protein
VYPKFPRAFTYGDLRPDLAGEFPYDITGHTIEMDIRRPDGTLLTKTAALVAPTLGTFKFVWVADDLQVGLNQLCLIRDLDADDAPLSTEKFFIDVVAGV